MQTGIDMSVILRMENEMEGFLFYSNGDKYVGDFKDDKYQGKGLYRFADGSQYKGTFEMINTTDTEFIFIHQAIDTLAICRRLENGKGVYILANRNKI